MDAPMETIWSLSSENRLVDVSCAPAARGAASGTAAPAVTSIARCRCRSAPLFRRTDRGTGIVRVENGSKILSGPRASDRAPLAHPDAVAVPVAVQRDPFERPIGSRRGFDGKIGAVEDLATRSPEDEPDVVAPDDEIPPCRGDRGRTDTPRRGARPDRDLLHGTGLSAGDGYVVLEVPRHGRIERCRIERTGPAETRGDVTVIPI